MSKTSEFPNNFLEIHFHFGNPTPFWTWFERWNPTVKNLQFWIYNFFSQNIKYNFFFNWGKNGTNHEYVFFFNLQRNVGEKNSKIHNSRLKIWSCTMIMRHIRIFDIISFQDLWGFAQICTDMSAKLFLCYCFWTILGAQQ